MSREPFSAADIGMLYHTAREYEDSAIACDTPALARFRVERTKKAADLKALADRLASFSVIPTTVGEEPGSPCKFCGGKTRRGKYSMDSCVDGWCRGARCADCDWFKADHPGDGFGEACEQYRACEQFRSSSVSSGSPINDEDESLVASFAADVRRHVTLAEQNIRSHRQLAVTFGENAGLRESHLNLASEAARELRQLRLVLDRLASRSSHSGSDTGAEKAALMYMQHLDFCEIRGNAQHGVCTCGHDVAREALIARTPSLGHERGAEPNG